MSHFSTLVITECRPDINRLDKILSPYDEDIEVPKYIVKTKEQLIEDERRFLLRQKEEFESHTDMAMSEKNYEKYIKPYISDIDNDETVLKSVLSNYDKDKLDENLNYVSTYNPKSKWDYWSVGGRWRNLFGKDTTIHKEDFPHVDLSVPEDKLPDTYRDHYHDWQRLSDGTHRLSKDNPPAYIKRVYPTFLDYLKGAINITTFAVVTLDGEWHEEGECLMFGVSSATSEETESWKNNYYDRFIKNLPDDYCLTIIDCHI